MGYRVFTDSRGTQWQTWDVVPQLGERRAGDRRRTPPPSAPPELEIDRRRTEERRVGVGGRPVLSAGLDAGWLCFEARVEKRRLVPIPPDWLRCDDARLERYCEQATPTRRSATAIDLSARAGFRN